MGNTLLGAQGQKESRETQGPLDFLDQEELEAREDLRDPATLQIAFQFMGKKEIKENQVFHSDLFYFTVTQ